MTRPYIICHMITGIDGKLHPSRFTAVAEGISADVLHGHYEKVAAGFEADGWLVGRRTMSEMAKGEPRPPSETSPLPRDPHIGDRDGRALAVTFDPKGRVHYRSSSLSGDHVVTILGEDVPDSYLAELKEVGVSYLFAGPDGEDLAGALAQLTSVFGVKRLLLEGGGAINGSFLTAGLIDEFSTLIFPGVDGLAGVQSIVDFHGAADARPGLGKALRLTSCEVLEGGMVWLRHTVETAPV